MMRSEIAQDKRAEIAAELVKFVTSTEFRNPIQATIRRTVELQEMIQDEAKTHKRLGSADGIITKTSSGTRAAFRTIFNWFCTAKSQRPFLGRRRPCYYFCRLRRTPP